MRWDRFAEDCPRIAKLAVQRFAADQLVILATLRADGLPRMSPCEPDIVSGRLCLGMIWQSRKARDLMRDPRIVVHSIPSDRMNPSGDIRLTGRAVDEQDPGIREEYRHVIRARISWAPDEPYFHLFSVDVTEAAFVRFGDNPVVWHWDEERGMRHLDHPDAPAGS